MRSKLVALALALAFSGDARGQAPSEPAVTAFVQDLMAVARLAGAVDATHGVIAAAPTGEIRISDIELSLPGDARLAIGAILIEGTDVTDRFRARRVTIDRLDWRLGQAVGGIERLALDDLDALAVPARFFAERGAIATFLGRFDLGRLSASHVRLFATGFPATETEFRDLAAGTISSGRVQRIGIAGATGIPLSSTLGSYRLELGAIRVDAVDLGLLAAFIAPPPSIERGEPAELLAEAAVEGVTYTSVDGGRITFAPMRAGPVRLRRPRYGLLEVIDALSTSPAQRSAADGERLMRLLQDHGDAWQVERIRLGPISGAGNAWTMRFAAVEADRLQPLGLGRLAFSGIELSDATGIQRLRSIEIGEVDFLTFMRAAIAEQAAANRPPADASVFDNRLPRIGSLAVQGAEISNPQISLESLTISMGEWIGYVPANLSVALTRLGIPAALTEIPGVRPLLRDLGLERVTYDGTVGLTIDEHGRIAMLSPLRLAIDDIGSMAAEITLQNVHRELLGYASLANPARLLQTVTLSSFRFRFEERGFVERFLSVIARTSRTTPDEVRRWLVASVDSGLDGIIADAQQRQRAKEAFAAFMQRPRSLTVDISAASGPSLAQLLAGYGGEAEGLRRLFDSLHVTVTAND